jgi:outer membrane protein assembly factor BamA
MGFPFVQISLDSIRISEAQIEANLKVSKGKYYTFKKLNIKGDSSISQRTIHGIIDYQLNEAYAELKVRDVDRKIEQCSFIASIKPAEIMYTSEGFEIFIYVKSIKVSFLRGALGLQPNPVSQKMALTGEVNLKLENALKKGELLKFNWRSIKPQTQRMNFNFNYPYLFQTPFGIEARLLLYKRDSTFLDLNTELNISYTLGNGFKLRAHYRFLQSSILSGAASSNEFSSLNGYRTNSYGLSVAKQKLDNLINPSKGRIFSSKLYVGQRILDEDSTEILDLKNTTLSGHLIYREFLPVFPRHVIHFAALFDFYSSTKIFENELYRFGGLNTLRGFNEEQLFASTKAQLTFEYRFLLDESSNVFLFYDQCFYENVASSYYNDNPFGFGGGISFGSNIGVFAITYAIGKEFSNPIDLRSSKIHFGYTAYF